jgi:thiamine pyrophosphate-dependent acetolactate synthase large subunit-like protein
LEKSVITKWAIQIKDATTIPEITRKAFLIAKLACPNDPVICITGDGGFLMNAAELETANRFGLSFIVIVLNDSMLKN